VREKSQRRVLIVEDDDSVRELLVAICRDEGYDVVDTVSGRDALALAHSDSPDLILIDWGLPDTNGVDVTRELRATGLTVPIVMLTGRAEEAEIETGLRAGADDYLTKPVAPRALAARLAAHLRRASRDGGKADTDELKARAATLAQVSIFFLAAPAAIRSLAATATTRTVRSGETVLSAGLRNDSLYVIRSGQFEVAAASPSGHAMPVAMLGTTDFFGAASVLTKAPSAANVVALEDGELLVVQRQYVLNAVPSDSPAGEELRKVVAQRQVLLRGAGTRAGHAASDRADLISIYSPKGGAGRTTIALNLAAAIGRQHRGDALLVDLSLPYNQAALLAGLAPSTSLARLWNTQDRFEELLESALVYHSNGFLVLSTALTPEEADLLTAPLLERAIAVLRRQFSHIVVDLGTTLSDPALNMLEASEHVFLVAVPEFSMMKDLIQAKRILLDVLQLPLGRVHLVVNHRHGSYRIGRREIETIVGMPVEHEIRFDGQRPEEAALRGQILAGSDPASTLTKAVVGMARALIERP
jgi:DNA-binding response OmpR family regulator/Flp pilus assembly CpaE family ATPase